MHPISKIILIVSCFSLISCMSVTGARKTPENSFEVKKLISYEYDQFKKVGWLHSADYDAPVEDGWNTSVKYSFRANYNENNKLSFIQLYMIYTSQNWLFINSLNDSNGKYYNPLLIDKYVNGGYVYETFGITISKKQLEDFSFKDYRFKVSGKNGSGIFTISKFVSEAFLTELNLRG